MLTTRFGIKGYFFIQQLSFRAIGFEANSADRIFERPFFAGMLGILFTLLMISWADNIARYRNDNLDELTDALLPFFHTSTVIYKIFTFILKHKKMMKLVQRIWLMTEKANNEERLIVAAESASDRKFSVFYYASCMSAFVLSSILPHFVSVFFYIRSGNLQMLGPLQLSTPFDQSKPFYYMITALWLVAGIYFIAHCATAMDTLYCWFIFNIAAQFRILQQHFENAAKLLDPVEMENAISHCIRRHQQVITLVNDFDEIFKQIIFVEFSINGLQTCLLTYLLSGGGLPFGKFLFFVVFLSIMMLQFLIYCYGGQRIQDESTNVGKQIYTVFPWHSVSIRNKKSLLLSLFRAQKECKITGIFFVSDWQLFIWVVRTTYSMITLLQSFKDENV